jgi:hypothetical protein
MIQRQIARVTSSLASASKDANTAPRSPSLMLSPMRGNVCAPVDFYTMDAKDIHGEGQGDVCRRRLRIGCGFVHRR